MIVVERVNKSFGKKQVLQNISLTFEKGKVNLVIGR
jgi:ABC-type multidrug transport system ATPase subunit